MASRNVTTRTTIQNLCSELKSTFAKKSAIPVKVSDLTNDSNFQTATQVESAINSKIASAYKPGGTKTAAELVAELLVAANEGKVYDISTKLTITDDNKALFVEGIEASYPVGTNFVVVNTGTDEAPAYKFDALPGFVDLSGLAEKVDGATAGHLAGLDANGNLTDSGIAADDVLTADDISDYTAQEIAEMLADD